MAELSKLGRYELRRILGKGAMGVVYEGFDPTLSRRVAVKTILKSAVTDEETAAAYSARFAREAKAAGRLNHPHIVQIYDFGEENDVAYLAMEFIQGQELRSCFEARQHFDAAETVRIMGELLDALEFAHQAGVIHRDVKPANIMLDEQLRVKLTDFGVARIQDGTDRSKSGGMVGTPAFMSPEQISGGRLDRRTDVFSAGIVLYQLLTNELPFKGSGAWTVAKQIMQDEPPRPSTIVGKISLAFDRIVSTALAKNPEHRFASAKEFATALHEALAGDGTAKGRAGSAQHGSDAEIEFWRSIQNSNDAAEFEVYLKGFPEGIYADLARLKISKLSRSAETSSAAPSALPRRPARDNAEVLKLAEETARLEAELAQREAAYRKRAAEAEAKRLAEEQARAEADAKRVAEAKAREAAEEMARLAAVEKAKQEAKAELAKREAEYRKREAEAAARAEAEASARREVEARTRREAEASAKAEIEARAKAKADADARARKNAEEQARRDAAIAKREAELRQHETELKAREAAAPRRKIPFVQVLIVLVAVIAAVIGAHYWKVASDEARLAELTSALDAATKATQVLSIARQRQEDLLQRVEIARLAESDARAKGDQAKLKVLEEQTKRAEAEAQKQNELVKQREAEAKKAGDAAKVADAKKQNDAAKAAEKAAQEKLAQEKAAQVKAAELAAAEKAAAEKVATEKAATEKAAVEKLAAEKASAAKRAAAAETTASPPEGVLPGRYAFRYMAGSGIERGCERVEFEEDIEIRTGSSKSISGSNFTDLRFQRSENSPVAATFFGRSSNVKLVGRATSIGYAGSYESRYNTAGIVCVGQWTLVRKSSAPAGAKVAEKSAPPLSVAAAAPGVSRPEGVLPGQYAIRLMASSEGPLACGQIDVQEDIEIRVDSSQSISGRGFADLRFQSAQDGSIGATMRSVRTRGAGSGDAILAGRAATTGYSGTYEWRGMGVGCTGNWSLVRK